MISYWLVFASAFGAATLLPFSSELAVVGALHAGSEPILIWIAASIGNTLGALVNWLVGRFTYRLKDQNWFPFSERQMKSGEQWFQKYGVWSLLFAWLPVGGDALTYIAGVLGVNFWVFLILTGIGKSLRYALLIGLTLNIF